MRVLGIDPGSRFTGYGVVEGERAALRHIAHGVIRPGEGPLEERLHYIFTELNGVFATVRPDAVAVEGLFSFKNARSALVLGHARGIALLVAAQGGLPVHEYSPAKVKKSIGAGGAGGKDTVARMVGTFLSLPELEAEARADASDALAVALCHLNHCRSGLPAAFLSGSSKPKRSSAAGGKFGHLLGRLSPSLVRPTGTD